MTTAIVVGTLYAGTWRAEADYVQTNLVSDIPGLATILDTSLVNPWGISHSATSPFWVSNQGTNTATLYAVTDTLNVTKNALTVAIPTTASGPQGPTGQVNNTGMSFQIGAAPAPAAFIFANLNGHHLRLEQQRRHDSRYPSDDPGRCLHWASHQPSS